MVLKKLLIILFVLFVSCIIAGINQYQAASGILTSRIVIFQVTFLLYFTTASALLAFSNRKLNEIVVLLLIFLPVIVLTINGLDVNWQTFYPYHFPLQTLVIILAEVTAYVFLDYSIGKKTGFYLALSLLLYVICFVAFKQSADEIKDKHIEVFSVNEHKNEVLNTLSKKLIDTSGRKLVLAGDKFYILNFSTNTSAPCQIKLQYLKEFALKTPDNLKVVYVANLGMETFDEFKSKLKADKDDKIIYAYLYDEDLLKKLDIDKYPSEIMVTPGFKLLREQQSFYEFDANTYEQQTLKLVKK